MALSTVEDAAFVIPDLSDPGTYVDDVPHAAFAAIQRRPGLYWQPTTLAAVNGGFWAVTRFADIVAIEKDPATFTSTRGAAYPQMMDGPIDGPSKDNIMMSDPPRHTRLRRVAAKGFGPRVVANFEPWIREIVRDAIASVADRDEFDFVEEFARTIPAYVVATILGTPREDRKRMVDWTTELFAAGQRTEGLAEGEGTLANVVETQLEVAAYAEQIREIKRAHPADDMCTVLNGCVDRGEINDAEFLQWMTLIMGAGYETTHTAIGQSMRMYLEDAEIRELTDRALAEGMIGRAVDEYFRLISPPMEMARTAVRDVDFLGQQIRERDVLVLYYVAANRDPAVFAEPNRFNPWRPETQTLAFGSGIHRCLGAHLAKLEVQILWEELRAAGLRLRRNGAPRRGWSNFINQLNELPVARV
jgi:cytochrome P450